MDPEAEALYRELSRPGGQPDEPPREASVYVGGLGCRTSANADSLAASWPSALMNSWGRRSWLVPTAGAVPDCVLATSSQATLVKLIHGRLPCFTHNVRA
jgi:hypothetical protein